MGILKFFFQPIQNFWDSFKITDGGFSMRKEIAFSVLIAFIYGNFKIFSNPANKDLFISVLFIDAAFISLCVGLVTAAEIIKFKNSKDNDKPTTDASPTA